jgi:hypothetical protein
MGAFCVSVGILKLERCNMKTTKFGIGLAQKGTTILGVFDTREEAVAFGKNYVDVPRSKGIVYLFSALYEDDQPVNNMKRIYDNLN